MVAYLKKQNAECARILNVSDVAHSIWWLCKLLSSYWDRDVFKTLSNIEDGAFCKKTGEFVELGHFNKHFILSLSRSLSLSLSLSLSVERPWMWLDMHQYPWIYLNIIENTWINYSDYAKALNMHNPLTCSTGFWRCLGYQIGQGSE